MSTITLEALTAAQRTALNGQAVITSEGLSGMARRFRVQATKARLFDKPVLAHTLRGYAHLAAHLALVASPGRWNFADPHAEVPAALLAPDGRYSCDGCEALIQRADLTTLPHGFFCVDCGQEQAA